MGLTAQLLGTVRRGARSLYGDGAFQAEINNGGDLLVAQTLPPYTELTRLGTRWSTSTPTANNFNTVAAWPTTLANIVISNGENYGGKSYVIDTIWGSFTATLATATSMVCLAQISNAGVALATNNTACLVTGSSGKVYNGNAKIAIANSSFAVANKWTVVGQSSGHPSTSIGAGVLADVAGRLIVPPGATLCINMVVSAVTVTCAIQGVDWWEVQMDGNY